jgi:plasmid stability protein
MTQVTIRRIEESWLEKAKIEAAERRVSMNQVLVEALRRGLGAETEPVRKTNLDRYAGDSDFDPEWDKFLEKDLKRLDPELWT